MFELLKEKPEKRINCDLKTPGLEIPRIPAGKGVWRGGTADLFRYGEFLFMKARPEKYPEVRVYWNIENLIPEPDLGRNICMKQMEQAFRTAVRYSAQCINMEYRLFTDRVMELLKAMGLGGSAWTVNDPEIIRSPMEKGIANITTRSLKTAVAVRKEMEG